jgi:hypothetical protein
MELIEHSIERADIIYEYQKTGSFIELEELLEFNNWCNFQEYYASEKDLTFDEESRDFSHWVKFQEDFYD